jgi:hypothetical protein
VPIDQPAIVTGRVRAAHLRVLSRILQHHVGESGMSKLRSERPELANAFAPTLAPLAWVELTELVAALQCSHDLLPDALVPRKVGRGTMSATFARLFGADPTSLPAETVMQALPTFWARYHDWGELTVAVQEGAADVTLVGYAGSPDVCALVGAELERVVELTGAVATGVSHPACAIIGARRCEYRLVWTR